jgi:hypothetical protein
LAHLVERRLNFVERPGRAAGPAAAQEWEFAGIENPALDFLAPVLGLRLVLLEPGRALNYSGRQKPALLVPARFEASFVPSD